MNLPYKEAVEHMLADMPRYIEAKTINLKKFKLPDGRTALVQISITCDDHEIDWFSKDWKPEKKATK